MCDDPNQPCVRRELELLEIAVEVLRILNGVTLTDAQAEVLEKFDACVRAHPWIETHEPH